VASFLSLVTVLVEDYDEAIAFYVEVLAFELVEDSPSVTGSGTPKRWVVVRPPHAPTGLLLARADGDEQAAAVGRQAPGRVAFFLHVDDFQVAYGRVEAAGCTIVSPPRVEAYGQVAVFCDLYGNRWDLIGPPPADSEA
jgi:catechol 2,3-dioxygenase-like lactoylglutathione lyase family enzyme